ncbi:aminoglycoside phosphotransferase family protein [Zhihengliuella sp.]|uniref:aminoglycoside phosphotransferase family protein n=1 Tax=Zhihengliuella sp. TaxID=1954483 RepID=UPI002811710A|nr:aminoglycoside phosphotransferase family protein [Zhihengliuella sp.]
MGIPEHDVEVDASLVAGLLADQHPDLAGLPLTRAAEGWDNVLFRLGDALAVRLPRRRSAEALLAAETEWLPGLAAGLPLPVPVPLRSGRPGRGYPYRWSIVPWRSGTSAALLPPEERDAYAPDLGAFLAALHRPAPADAPSNPYRGVPLEARRVAVGARLAEAGGDGSHGSGSAGGAILPPAAVGTLRDILDEAASAPAFTGPPLWLHGDPHPHNLVVETAAPTVASPGEPPAARPAAAPTVRLAAVVDFGDLTAGDPASDLGAAWMHFTPAGLERFRAAARAGGATYDADVWRRARGWAVAYGLIAALHPPAEPLHAVGLHTLAGLLGTAG